MTFVTEEGDDGSGKSGNRVSDRGFAKTRGHEKVEQVKQRTLAMQMGHEDAGLTKDDDLLHPSYHPKCLEIE